MSKKSDVPIRIFQPLTTYHLHWDSYFSGDVYAFSYFPDPDFVLIGKGDWGAWNGNADMVKFFRTNTKAVKGQLRLKKLKTSTRNTTDFLLVSEVACLFAPSLETPFFHSKFHTSSLFRKMSDGSKFFQQRENEFSLIKQENPHLRM
ncbi:hypothetical protein J0A67_07130 [Algoriphagus aestuariicola]|uniref:Uncharacterized protein n=1 Tax=Algoriphagus aestuariicola TaxID=1852016 RepID=A0ABS3BMX6_9BACT|nr:hypothetical protein [Algoriphagus aestuariicola]MBN7800627.1 hypothetical protein [Algoriphagus aestuariicola]